MAAGVGAAADQPGRHHPRIVDHQAIAPAKDIGHVADVAVFQRVAAAIDDHHPGIAATDGRRLGNQLLRQIVVVLIQFRHDMAPHNGALLGKLSFTRTAQIEYKRRARVVGGAHAAYTSP